MSWYASKAFLNKEAARIVADEGLVSSTCSGGGELAIAWRAGFPTERIFMHGNNKTPRELREAIQAGVGRIIIDSRIELSASPRSRASWASCSLFTCASRRVSRPTPISTSARVARTRSSASPCATDFAYGCVKDVLAAPNVRLAGLHCHIGSQIFALHSYPEAVEVMVELMARIEEGYGLSL